MLTYEEKKEILKEWNEEDISFSKELGIKHKEYTMEDIPWDEIEVNNIYFSSKSDFTKILSDEEISFLLDGKELLEEDFETLEECV